jgi:uncharacterized membrane protein YgcG
VAAVIAAGIVLTPGAAMAAPVSCDSTIIDSANLLGSKTNQVQQAAQGLNSVGADVRVVTVTSFKPYSTLDDYVKTDLVGGCGSWQSANGGMKTNLVIFAVSTQPHGVAIYYGDAWKNAFSGANSDARIKGDYMVPQLQNGDFGKAFVNGINEVRRVLNNYLHPGSTSANKPAGKSQAGLVAGIVFGTLFLIALLLGVGWWVLRRRSDNEKRETARQRALTARDKTTSILGEIGDSNSSNGTVRKAKVAKYAAADPSTARALKQALGDVDANYNSAMDAMPAATTAAGTADDKGLSISVYEALASRYEDALAFATEARNGCNVINDTAAGIDQQLQRVGDTLTALGSRLDALAGKVMNLTDMQVHTDVVQQLADKATQALNAAREHSTDLKVLVELKKVETLVTAAEQAEQTLEEQRSRLATGLPIMEERINQVTAMVPKAQEAFDRFSPEYVEGSWESVRGNGTEAQKRIHVARTTLDDAKVSAGLDKQQWDDAVAKMESTGKLLAEAHSLLTSVIDMEQKLASAKLNAPAEIAAAQADLDKAGQYIKANAADVDPGLKDKLRQAGNTLLKAKKEMTQDKPNYLEVVKLALQANHHADDIFDEAVKEFEAAERLRRQATSMLREAESSVDTADSYIRHHSGDVRSGAKSNLADAKRFLDAAKKATDPSEVLRNAQRCDKLADDAYDDAKRDHRRAEDSRSYSPSYGGGYNSSGSGFTTGLIVGDLIGSSSGGSNWGSSGGGFGGSSSSFGGGGGFNGTSSGW